MSDIKEKMNRWQHEDTGRLVDMPVGKNPGHRWYLIPRLKKEQVKQMNKKLKEKQIKQINKKGQIFKKAMISLAKRVLETTNAMKKFGDVMGRIKIKKVPRISCKIKKDK